jgi:predicted RNase H-like nuclease (RuvC/YqgF family)
MSAATRARTVDKIVRKARNESIYLRRYSRPYDRRASDDAAQMFDDLADAVEAQAAEVERLRARVAEYEKDAERLDWLERHIRTRYDVNLDRRPDREIEPDDSLAGFAVSCEPKMIYQGQGETLREAIDAALAPRGPGDSEGGR